MSHTFFCECSFIVRFFSGLPGGAGGLTGVSGLIFNDARLPPAAWSRFSQDLRVAPDVLQVPLTHGAVGAPVDPQRGGRPVARLTRLRR